MSRASEFDERRWAATCDELASHGIYDAEGFIEDTVGVAGHDKGELKSFCAACYGMTGSIPDYIWKDSPGSDDSFTCTSCGRTFIEVELRHTSLEGDIECDDRDNLF